MSDELMLSEIVIRQEFKKLSDHMNRYTPYCFDASFPYHYYPLQSYQTPYMFMPYQQEHSKNCYHSVTNTQRSQPKKEQNNPFPCVQYPPTVNNIGKEKNERSRLPEKNQLQIHQEEMMSVQNRNIHPNIINLIVSYVRRVNKSGLIVKKILRKYTDERYTLKKFYAYQIYLKSVITNYSSKNILHQIINFCNPSSSIFKVDEQLYFNKICRSLIMYYLTVDGPLGLLTSKKELKTKKRDHFKVYRYIFNELRHQERKQGIKRV